MNEETRSLRERLKAEMLNTWLENTANLSEGQRIETVLITIATQLEFLCRQFEVEEVEEAK